MGCMNLKKLVDSLLGKDFKNKDVKDFWCVYMLVSYDNDEWGVLVFFCFKVKFGFVFFVILVLRKKQVVGSGFFLCVNVFVIGVLFGKYIFGIFLGKFFIYIIDRFVLNIIILLFI